MNVFQINFHRQMQRHYQLRAEECPVEMLPDCVAAARLHHLAQHDPRAAAVLAMSADAARILSVAKNLT